MSFFQQLLGPGLPTFSVLIYRIQFFLFIFIWESEFSIYLLSSSMVVGYLFTLGKYLMRKLRAVVFGMLPHYMQGSSNWCLTVNCCEIISFFHINCIAKDLCGVFLITEFLRAFTRDLLLHKWVVFASESADSSLGLVLVSDHFAHRKAYDIFRLWELEIRIGSWFVIHRTSRALGISPVHRCSIWLFEIYFLMQSGSEIVIFIDLIFKEIINFPFFCLLPFGFLLSQCCHLFINPFKSFVIKVFMLLSLLLFTKL